MARRPLWKTIALAVLAIVVMQGIRRFCTKFDLFAPAYSEQLLLLVLTILLALVIAKLEGVGFRNLGWARPVLGLAGMAVGGLFVLTVVGTSWALGLVRAGAAGEDVSLLRGWWYLPFIFTCVALSEEIFYRGLVFRLLSRGLGIWSAAIVSSIFFSADHVFNPYAQPDMIGLITLFAYGLVGAVSYAGTGSLWFPIGLHLTWNLTQGLTVAGFTYTGSIWATQSFFGLEGWPLTMVLTIVLAALACVWARPKARKWSESLSLPH